MKKNIFDANRDEKRVSVLCGPCQHLSTWIWNAANTFICVGPRDLSLYFLSGGGGKCLIVRVFVNRRLGVINDGGGEDGVT